MKKTNVLKHASPASVVSARPRWLLTSPLVFIKVESTQTANSHAAGESTRETTGKARTNGDVLVPAVAATAKPLLAES